MQENDMEWQYTVLVLVKQNSIYLQENTFN
jgi:hypothetical protein